MDRHDILPRGLPVLPGTGCTVAAQRGQPPLPALPGPDIVARALAVLEEECRLWASRSPGRPPGLP